jgi:DNA-binding winged helix-turn-helix (wHTH) protein/tetratricopeptide (TPR) repeat protein
MNRPVWAAVGQSGGNSQLIHRFGQFELDASARELRRNGAVVDAEPKAFELLLYLIANADRAVSKDELQTALWPHTMVTEASLTRCVMKARRAVDDDANRQAVIRTVHKHGYRFVADLVPSGIEESPADTATRTGIHVVPNRRWKPRTTHYAFAAAIVILIGLAVTALKLRDPPPPVTSGTVAVLPVHNKVDDENLAWVRIGLMSLLSRMLEDAGISVGSERAVLSIASDGDLAAPPNNDMLTRLRREAGAGVVLNTTLDLQGGLYRLAATLTYGDGHRTRRVIVGESPAELAADMARVIAGVVSAADRQAEGRFSRVSTDPFVNETYARALDLELQGRLEDARKLFQAAAKEEPDLFYLRYEIALCTRDLREWDSAEAQFEALYQEAMEGSDPRALIVTLNSLGVLHFNRNEYNAAEANFREALKVAGDERFTSERATVHINLALIAGRRGDNLSARQHYDNALQAYEQLGRQPSPNFDNNYAGLLLELGDVELAQVYAERAVEGFRMLGQRRFEAPALNRLAKVLRRRGDVDAALARHEQALSIYRELGDEIGELSVMSSLTVVYRENGDLTRARLNAAEVEQRASTLDSELLKADAYMQTALVAAALDMHDEAIDGFSDALAIYEDLGEATSVRDANEGIALSSLALGDRARATIIAQLALETAVASESKVGQARARWMLGHIARVSEEPEAGKSHFRAALEYARDNDDDAVLIDAAIGVAWISLDSGDIPTALSLADEIREIAARRHEFMRLDARIASARGDTDAAIDIMSGLRMTAGESWQGEDEAYLLALQESGPEAGK